ncbi:DUF4283 domain-containing protein [Raphanus sativus]|nr:DUF4283 domain-containing protein [Raphanus sativus]
MLKRLAPLTYSENGVPQVTIPDEVFQRGAEFHKDFILGSFLAKMPSYQAIQSVFNFIWGKGQKLDIRTNKENRTIMVRIPNDYIRKKVLEKRILYIGTAMFQAHLHGLLLDLRSLEGLSFAAGLIGEPKETDEFTKNIADVDIAHVKIEADLTKPLPYLIELKRSSGEIIPVRVEYPWTPPICSSCKQIGHIFKDCLTATHVWVEKQPGAKLANTEKVNHKENLPSQEPTDTQMTDAPPLETPAKPETEPVSDPITPPIPEPDFVADLQEILSAPPTPSASLEPRDPILSPNPFVVASPSPSAITPFTHPSFFPRLTPPLSLSPLFLRTLILWLLLLPSTPNQDDPHPLNTKSQKIALFLLLTYQFP